MTQLPRYWVFFAAVALHAQTLKIADFTFHQFEDGPSFRPSVYWDGERVFVSFLIDGYKANEKNMIALDWTLEARDEAGVALVAAASGKVEAELQPEDKEWKPKLRHQFEAPQTASCVACKLAVTVSDRIGGTEGKLDVSFGIRTRAVAPSETLAVRNFRFLRAEEDGKALAVAAYRPGDDVWARFEMTGYKFGEKNRVQVEYGLSVFRPSGKLLYTEPKAASADDVSFYPKKWLPGILSLKLDSKMPPGEYPIVLEVRDLVGGQKHEERVTFRIE
ncbi:MAG: hypothetical protein SFV51_22235 [Bryobacteraceae bacterium]|nr:hypothetical protein [Bryobacteraceae bacterium]